MTQLTDFSQGAGSPVSSVVVRMGGIRHRRQRHRPPRRPDDAARRSGGEPGRPRGAGYDDIVKENAKFEAFYRRQGVCADEAELQKMMATLRRDLPASFRVTGFRSQVTMCICTVDSLCKRITGAMKSLSFVQVLLRPLLM